MGGRGIFGPKKKTVKPALKYRIDKPDNMWLGAAHLQPGREVMPADQRNFAFSDYLSDDGTHYCMKADAAWIANTDSGGAACTTGNAYGAKTSRRKPRTAIYIDSTTFRSAAYPVFTPTAAAALTPGTDTLAVHVPGETATVTYTLARIAPERRPNLVLTSSKADHA